MNIAILLSALLFTACSNHTGIEKVSGKIENVGSYIQKYDYGSRTVIRFKLSNGITYETLPHYGEGLFIVPGDSIEFTNAMPYVFTVRVIRP